MEENGVCQLPNATSNLSDLRPLLELFQSISIFCRSDSIYPHILFFLYPCGAF